MTGTFPITPPPELVQEWWEEACRDKRSTKAYFDHVATNAAQWGADMELEACKQFMHDQDWFMSPILRMAQLHNARRPKPPSLKEQALKALDDISIASFEQNAANIIRRALEQLDD